MNPSSVNFLLAVDGSRHSKAAADFLRDLPLSEGASVTVLGVVSTHQKADQEPLQAVLEHTEQMLREVGAQVDTQLKFGNPAEIVMVYAQDLNAELIVLGAKGRRATLGILLGGVAQQVVEYANHPVAIIRAPYEGLKRVLLVTDGSIYSQRAVAYLAGTQGEEKFPLPKDAELHVAHVLPPLTTPEPIAHAWPVGPEMLPPVPTEIPNEASWKAEEEHHGQTILEQTLETLKAAGLQATSALLRGDAATEIIDYAKVHQVDLIVAGSRGLSPVRSWLLGSVSRKIIHYAHCSTLIVKSKAQE
jgi:nucleotide-binding universal stress UspA family protein